MEFATEYSFTLPRGYIDTDGNVHVKGTMRLATAADEIIPLKDPRVRQNPDYLSIILLARVVTKLGSLPMVDTAVIERLLIADLAFLQDFYQRINAIEPAKLNVVCPHCGHRHEVEVPLVGEN